MGQPGEAAGPGQVVTTPWPPSAIAGGGGEARAQGQAGTGTGSGSSARSRQQPLSGHRALSRARNGPAHGAPTDSLPPEALT